MNKERKLIIAGNWKMNKTVAEALAWCATSSSNWPSEGSGHRGLPAVHRAGESVSKAILDSNIRLGAQNMSENNFGAFTGEIAPACSRNFPCATSSWAIPSGASTKRNPTRSSPKRRRPPTRLAQADCLRRRNLAEREAGQMEKVLETQVRGSLAGLTKEQMAETIVAYEPVWAIGTGKTATTQQAQDAHAFIRGLLVKMFDDAVAKKVRIQYGGSVKPNNAAS
jgi:triosephosphate isomerase (TIM)